MTTIGFMGLGAMGSRMARNLIEAGFTVTVYNRSPEPAEALAALGARTAATPREAVRDAELCIAMVRDDEASHAVWLDTRTGALADMREGALAIEMSTLTPAWTREWAAAARERGISPLEAPVVGSRPQAEARQLVVLAGGAEETLERARPALAAMAGAIHRAGEIGMGAAMKLVVNAWFATQVAAVSELLALVETVGIDPERGTEILTGLPVTSPALKGVIAQIATRAYAPMFPVELVAKDLAYARALGRHVNAGVPLIETSAAVFDKAVAAGHGDLNISGVASLYQTTKLKC